MQYKPKALLRSDLRLVACQHHPDVSFGWGYATISLRTKKVKGLHENDFIMASKIDRMFNVLQRPPDR